MARATGMHYKAKGEMMGELRGKHSVASTGEGLITVTIVNLYYCKSE